MKKIFQLVAILVVLLVMASCAQTPPPIIVVVTSTPPPATQTPFVILVTATPPPTLMPTNTPEPTSTRRATATITPEPSPTDLTDDLIMGSDIMDSFCTQGGFPLSSASAYDPKTRPPRMHVFSNDNRSKSYGFQDDIFIPNEWNTRYLSYADTELVLCISFVSLDELVQSCKYYSTSSSAAFTVNDYAATWNVILYIAKTGKVLHSTRMSTRTTMLGCSSMVTHYGDATFENDVVDIKKTDIVSWLSKTGVTP